MRLRPSDPGPRLAVGLQGSGKSYGVAREVERAAQLYPVIVVDTVKEWTDYEPPPGLDARGARTAERAIKHVEEGAQLVVVQPKGDEDAELVVADEVCRWALKRDGKAGVVFPEAHELFPMGSRLPRYVRKVVKQARHWGVAMFSDTQRLAELHPAITSAASGGELRLYALFADTDLKAVQRLGGLPLREAVLRIYDEHFSLAVDGCCFEGCEKCAPHRGWFVTAGRGPFTPERDDGR